MNSTTLKVGDRAPEFSLRSANRRSATSLATLLDRGPVIIEFLRGTW